jgi:hypothetical protein
MVEHRWRNDMLGSTIAATTRKTIAAREVQRLSERLIGE